MTAGWRRSGGLHASGDTDTIPGIDVDDSHDDLRKVSLIEEPGGLLVRAVGDMPADECDFFCQSQDGAFFGRKVGGFPPGVEGIDTLFGFACLTGIACMFVDTEGAAIDLGGPDLDEVFVRLAEAAGLYIVREGVEGFVGSGLCLPDPDPCAHGWMLL